MIDFFELVYGMTLDKLPLGATLAVQHVNGIRFLEKHFSPGTWIRFGTLQSAGVIGAKIESMYTINTVPYLVLHAYAELQPNSEGCLHLDSTCVPERRVVAFGDLVYINGLWAAGAGNFVEMHM